MTKTKQIAAAPLPLTQAAPRNPLRTLQSTSAAARSRQPQAVLTVKFVGNSRPITDQNFSSASATQYESYAGSPSQRLLVPASGDRDLSSGANSSSHAENKHVITVNRTKTPKIGIHMKNFNNCMRRKVVVTSPQQNVQQGKHLVLPHQKDVEMNGSSSQAQLSTRGQTCSAHSICSQASSAKRLDSQDSTSSGMLACSGRMEEPAFSMAPAEVMQLRLLKQLRESIP